MKSHISVFALAILIFSLAIPLNADTSRYSVDMSIRQIAHDVGLKGREFAELLGLEGSVDKDTALAELGISPLQLETALESVSLPEQAMKKQLQISTRK